MTYTKPVLKGFSAIEAIQIANPNAKSTSVLENGSQTLRTQPAYEADE